MNNDLFRKESLDAKKSKVLGSVALYCPLTAGWSLPWFVCW